MAPVKSLHLVSVDAIELDTTGVRGDRRFYLVDDSGALVNAKRVPQLLAVHAAAVGGRLRLVFPDGTTVEDEVRLGEPIETSFFRRPVVGRIVDGPWAEPLSEIAGKGVRIARTESEGDGFDRGASAGASMVSTGSLEALRAATGADRPVDGRRFRMTIGIDAAEPHVEDGWIGSRVRVGSAMVFVREHTGRCAVTTLDPDSGIRDLDTLRAISVYRSDVPTREPLPFGVWCEVVEPGPVAVGDPVEAE